MCGLCFCFFGWSNNLLFKGKMYQEAHVVPRNIVKAESFSLAAASQGIPEAQHNLGVLYMLGKGRS